MQMHAAYRPGGHRRSASAVRLAAALVTAGCAVALCACGSSAGGGQSAAGATTATGDASPMALSRCMRGHGIESFPDPGNGPGGQGLSISSSPGSPTLTVQGITFSGPEFQKAEQACKDYLTAKGPPPQLSAAKRAQMLVFARCMRTRGVPSFADPTATGPIGVASKSRSKAFSNSPAFNRAVQACGGLRTR
jgi:hypothetical protein